MWNTAILERFRRRPLLPCWWGFNANMQTVLLNMVNSLDAQLKPFPSYRREEIAAFDGNKVMLDWASETDAFPADAPVVIILHGIMGNADENYCR